MSSILTLRQQRLSQIDLHGRSRADTLCSLSRRRCLLQSLYWSQIQCVRHSNSAPKTALRPSLSASSPVVQWTFPFARPGQLRCATIYGQEIIPNGAGPQGYGYGDGRAISIGEIALGTNENALGTAHTGPQPSVRYELQLKGAGRTPFCRHADGRAVLRSSAREFVASEAMAALGVPTTRALSLIVSSTERVTRPWYRNASSAIAIGAHRPDRESGGDITRRERTAITTRMAASFLRVGQFELYGRRARGGDQVGL